MATTVHLTGFVGAEPEHRLTRPRTLTRAIPSHDNCVFVYAGRWATDPEPGVQVAVLLPPFSVHEPGDDTVGWDCEVESWNSLPQAHLRAYGRFRTIGEDLPSPSLPERRGAWVG